MRFLRSNCCPSPEHLISRRRFLFGAAGAAGFLAAARRGEAQTLPGVSPRGSAKACIFITMNGAPSHVDTWDPKDGPWNPPDADLQQHPGGIVLSNRLFPGLSRMTNDLLLLRSVMSW